jgi:hypothetical protein
VQYKRSAHDWPSTSLLGVLYALIALDICGKGGRTMGQGILNLKTRDGGLNQEHRSDSHRAAAILIRQLPHTLYLSVPAAVKSAMSEIYQTYPNSRPWLSLQHKLGYLKILLPIRILYFHPIRSSRSYIQGAARRWCGI